MQRSNHSDAHLLMGGEQRNLTKRNLGEMRRRVLVGLPVMLALSFVISQTNSAEVRGASPTAPPGIEALAARCFYQFQCARIERSQFDAVSNRELTDAVVSREAQRLRVLGKPSYFRYLGSEPLQEVTGYDFLVVFHGARVIESVAIDGAGEIAGVDFRIFLPRHPASAAPS